MIRKRHTWGWISVGLFAVCAGFSFRPIVQGKYWGAAIIFSGFGVMFLITWIAEKKIEDKKADMSRWDLNHPNHKDDEGSS